MKRNCSMVIRFTRAELEAVTKKARKAGLSRESFCRAVLGGANVHEAPDVDVLMLLRELRRVGNNVNQTLKRANSTGIVDMPQFRKDMADIRKATEKIMEAYGVE